MELGALIRIMGLASFTFDLKTGLRFRTSLTRDLGKIQIDFYIFFSVFYLSYRSAAVILLTKNGKSQT